MGDVCQSEPGMGRSPGRLTNAEGLRRGARQIPGADRVSRTYGTARYSSGVEASGDSWIAGRRTSPRRLLILAQNSTTGNRTHLFLRRPAHPHWWFSSWGAGDGRETTSSGRGGHPVWCAADHAERPVMGTEAGAGGLRPRRATRRRRQGRTQCATAFADGEFDSVAVGSNDT